MNAAAIRVFAVLQKAPQTETEIALATGLTLAEVSQALAVLSLTGEIVETDVDRLRKYAIVEVES